MDLEYVVTNQVIERSDRNRPANLSQEYLELSFTFSDDWTGLAKFALFKTSEGTLRSALSQDKVTVPVCALSDKKFLFSLYGVDGNDLRITTNLVRVNLLESGFTHEVINDDSDLDEPTTVEEIYTEIAKKAYITDVNTALSERYTKTEVDNLIYGINNHITLEADKTIIENEETCTFTVYVLKDGFQRAGETVNIYAEEI